MIVYLINKENNEVEQVFKNVKRWDYNFVVYDNNGYFGTIYCTENEFFTDIEPIELEKEREEQETN